MHLSKRTQYGIRSLLCFAEVYERGYLQARELSAREKLPLKFLESILNALTRAKLLKSKIGAGGGYRLARAPQSIVLGEVIMRLEGKFLQEDLREQPHERPGDVAIRIIQTRLAEAARSVLETMTLAELVEQVGHHGRGQMYYI